VKNKYNITLKYNLILIFHWAQAVPTSAHQV